MNSFETLNAINVNEHTEQKGDLTYLSWAWAWSAAKKIYPNAKYEVKKFDGGFPYLYDENTGYMVFTSVTIEDLTYEMWLPVMDYRNKALKSPSMTDINKTIMRCLVKNLAMFGLGLYIYAGEDLPEGENPNELPFPEAEGMQTKVNDSDMKMLEAFLIIYPKAQRETYMKSVYAQYGIKDLKELTKAQYVAFRTELSKNANAVMKKRLEKMVSDFAKKANTDIEEARLLIETGIEKAIDDINIAEFPAYKKKIQVMYNDLGASNETTGV